MSASRTITTALAEGIAWFVTPVGWPLWATEWLVRRGGKHRDWEFGTYSATPYLLLLTLLGTMGVFTANLAFKVAGLYVLTALELIALWLSACLAVGRPSVGLALLKNLSRRRREIPETNLLAKPTSFFQALIAFGYNSYYFTCLGFFLHSMRPAWFEGVRSAEPLPVFWQFLYTSVSIVTTSGAVNIVPTAFGAEFLFALEAVMGLLFIVFLLSAFVANHVRASAESDRGS